MLTKEFLLRNHLKGNKDHFVSTGVHVALVGQLPPPFHGQSIAIEALATALWVDVVLHPVRLDMSDTMESVGRWSLMKIPRLFRCIRRTRRVLKKYKPCVLYYPPGGGDLVPFIRDLIFLFFVRRCAAVTVFHFHAGGMGRYVTTSILRRWSLPLFASVDIAVQPTVSGQHDGEILSAHTVYHIPAGIPDPGNLVGRRGRPPGNRYRILVVGHLCHEKGTGLLPAIAARLCDVADIEIMGSWRSLAYREKIMAQFTSRNVRFLGSQMNEEKWKSFERADVLLFPSFQETQGLVAVEAMACGLPVVVSEIDGIRDVICNEREGLLVSPCSVDAFVDAICRICGDHVLWQAMSKAGRVRYLEHFTIAQYRQRMHRVFLECQKLLNV